MSVSCVEKATHYEPNTMKKPSGLLLALFLYPVFLSAQTLPHDSAYVFTDSVLAFRVTVPFKTVIKIPSANDPSKEIRSQLYYCQDSRENISYIFGVNYLSPDHVMGNDSIYFTGLKKSLGNQFYTISRDTSYLSNGYFVIELIGKLKTDKEKLTVSRHIARGNRWYVLVVTFPLSGATPSVTKFFRSFSILDFPVLDWQRSVSPDSSLMSWTPSPLRLLPPDSSTAGVDRHYVSFDSIRSNGYNIDRYQLNPYYWSPSDSAFWKERIAISLRETETLIYKKPIVNGNAKGWEWVKLNGNSKIYQRIRCLMNGDQLYYLYTSALKDDIVSANANKFFENFRFSRPPAKTHLFDNKVRSLTDALFGTDPAAAANALVYVEKAPFERKDLSLLHALLLKRPALQGGLRPAKVNAEITQCILVLKDSSSFRFATEHYKSISEADGFIKENLLKIMSRFPDPAHYEEMAGLLKASPPPSSPLFYVEFIFTLETHLHVTARVMPQLMFLIADSNARTYFTRLAGILADSGLLTAAAIQPHEKAILSFAARRIADLSTDYGDPRNYDGGLITLLGLLNNAASHAALREFLETEFHELRIKAFAALLRDGKQTKTDIDSLAADKSTRLDLYRILRKAGKASLFPSSFRTQKMFSESEVYSKAMEIELEPPSAIDLFTTKTVDTDAGIKKYYFYKIDRKDGFHLLACAGPYGPNPRDEDSPAVAAVVDYQHIFDPAHAEEQMNKLLVRCK